MRHYKPSKPFSLHARRPKAVPDLRKAETASKMLGVSGSAEAAPVSETASGTMTTEELIGRAKRHIGNGETSRISSFRAAADDIALACDQGAKQCEVAEGVGKSAAWVNRLLKWREGGYIGAPFADKILQGVKKELTPLEPPFIEAAPPQALGETNAVASAVQEAINAEAAAAPVTKVLSAVRASDDYHLPAACNRQDPGRAFQRLVEQWPSSPFRDLLLDSPEAAQGRFVRDVLLPELGGPEAVGLSPSAEGSDQ